MQRRYNRRYFVLAMVVFFSLTPLMIGIDAHAQIAFVSSENGIADIYVTDADGGNRKNLTKNRHRHSSFQPSWSPDGKRIAFASDSDDGRDIYVMDADGGNFQNLTNSPLRHEYHPAWYSPPFAAEPAGKTFTMWGWLKQVVQ